MRRQILFITGTDTGVGKTVLATWLTRRLCERHVAVVALKPICSGSRADARRLWTAAGRRLTLDEVNPWHFRAPLAPLVAARLEHRRLRLAQVLCHLRRLCRRFEVMIVEGAGGLLSPLGVDFTARDLIMGLRATPIVVCPNRLGALNQTFLVLAALPSGAARRAQIVLMAQPRSDHACRSNVAMLSEKLRPSRIHTFPWLGDGWRVRPGTRTTVLRKKLDALLRAAGIRLSAE